jgi:hypothetical protein
MKLTMSDQRLTERYGVKDWLEEVEKLLYGEFNRGKIYRELPGMIRNAATFGHGLILIDENIAENRIRAMNVNIAETFLDIDEGGDITTVYRRFTMTLKQAAEFFGEDRLNKQYKKDYEDRKKWRDEVPVVHAVFPRAERDREKNDRKNKPFASVFLDAEHNEIIEESGYDTFPYAVFVWDRKPGSAYGLSPAIEALDEVRTLNMSRETLLQVAQMSAHPVIVIPNHLKGDDEILPDRHIYLNPGEQVPVAINVGANYPITMEITRDFEQNIRNIFHVDFFLMLQQQQGLSQMTATAITGLQGEKAAVMGDLVAGLNLALKTIVKRSYNILMARGRLPEPPAAIRESDALLDVEFTGVLAQIQKRHYETPQIVNSIGIISQIAKLGQLVPEARKALAFIDFAELLKTGLNGESLPQKIIRENDDVEAIWAAEAQAQQQAARQQAAMEERKMMMSNYGKLNEPVQPGSAIAQIDTALQGGAG